MIFHTIDFDLPDDDKQLTLQIDLLEKIKKRNLYTTQVIIIHPPLKIELENQFKSS